MSTFPWVALGAVIGGLIAWGIGEITLRILRRVGTPPLLLEAFLSGVAMSALWIAGVAVLLIVTREGNAGLWIVFTPVAFALGIAGGFFAHWRSRR